MTMRAIAALAGLITFVSPAYAQSGPYAAGSVGYIFPESVGSSIGLEAGTERGYSLIGAAGYAFRSFRVELEGSYRESGVDEARGFGFSVQGAGEVSALSAMANAYFEPAIQVGPLQPYIGAGAGISRFKADEVEAVGIPNLEPVSASETGFAYQFMAGAGWRISEQATLAAGYRYFATPNIETTVEPFGPVEIDGLGVHAVEMGIRLRF
jgi:opacity protein-like surface antigen